MLSQAKVRSAIIRGGMGHQWARGFVSHRQLGGGRAELAPLSNSFLPNLLFICLRLDLASNIAALIPNLGNERHLKHTRRE